MLVIRFLRRLGQKQKRKDIFFAYFRLLGHVQKSQKRSQ